MTKLKEINKNVSILHINSRNHCFLYGEHNGLSITELSPEIIMLTGEEADIFFEADYNYVCDLLKL